MRLNKSLDFDVPKLDIKEVLKKTFETYKLGFISFTKISTLLFLLNFVSSLMIYGIKLAEGNQFMLFIGILLLLVLFPIYVYFNVRAEISLYLHTEELLRNSKSSVKEAYEKSIDLFWRYFKIYVLFETMLLVPTSGIILVYKFIENTILKYTTILIFAIPLIYLFVTYSLTLVSGIFVEGKNNCFEKSKLLVKGDFWGVLFLTSLLTIIFTIPYQFYIRVILGIDKIGELQRFIFSIMNQAIEIFSMPLTIIISVVMYNLLKRNKRIG